MFGGADASAPGLVRLSGYGWLMKRPHTEDGPIESGDLVIWLGDDGEVRAQTAPDPDEILADEVGLLRGLFAETRDDAIAAIDAAVELDVFDVTWGTDGLSVVVGDGRTGTEFEMVYPFTMSAFWAELEAVEESAIENLGSQDD